MNRIQQAIVWLRRVGHSRGFGIQSPTDYRFVRYVVNEHWPYYAYAVLGKNDGWQRRKLGRLYFRLANHFQPAVVLDLVGVGEYVQAGCRKAALVHEAAASPDLVIAPPSADLSRLLGFCGGQTVLVIEDVDHHPELWAAIAEQPRPAVTFDLYYCGIVCFDARRTRQHYVVNF